MGPSLKTCLRVAGIVSVGVALSGCPSQPTQQTCVFGSPVVVAAGDTSPPSVAMEFLVGGGQALPVTGGTIVAPPGRVTVIAQATDPQGPKDIQIWVETIRCTVAAGQTSCNAPDLAGRPMASNPNRASVGDPTCSQRIAQTNLDVVATPFRTVKFRVRAVAVNFAGQTADVGYWNLQAQ